MPDTKFVASAGGISDSFFVPQTNGRDDLARWFCSEQLVEYNNDFGPDQKVTPAES